VVYLAGEPSSFVTGHVLVMDGGHTLFWSERSAVSHRTRELSRDRSAVALVRTGHGL
jgi:hypothetical protein